ncbi:MAG: hypothetical protein V7742_09580, partial [Halioglobus sp.]
MFSNKSPRYGGITSACCRKLLLPIVAFVVSLGSVGNVWAQSCPASIAPNVLTAGPHVEGDVVRIRADFDVDPIQNGTSTSFGSYNYKMDCNNGPSIFETCDESDGIVGLVGNITTNCQAADSSPIIWTTLPNTGGADPADPVQFLPGSAVVIPEGSSCFIEYDVQILDISSIAVTGSLLSIPTAPAADFQCDNGFPALARVSLGIEVEFCGDAELDTGEQCDDGNTIDTD